MRFMLYVWVFFVGFECTYSHHAFKVALYVWLSFTCISVVFVDGFECTYSHLALLRLYVWLSFACMSVMEAWF